MKKKNKKLIIPMTFAVIIIITLVSIGAFKAMEPKDELLKYVERIGMLNAASCGLFEGCGAEFKLIPKNPQHPQEHTPLVGNINKDHDQLIIKVSGKERPMKENEFKGDLSYKPETVIEVESYELLSKLPFKKFLSEKIRTYTKETYPCSISWGGGDLSWSIDAEQVLFKANLVRNPKKNIYIPYVELHYDGNTGELLNTIDNLDGKDPCKDEL